MARPKKPAPALSPRMREWAEELRQTMRRVSGADAATKTRERDNVVARAMIAHVLLEMGMTTIQVGALLGKNHATISHYRNLMAAFMSSPGYTVERELWNDFSKAVKNAQEAKAARQI